MCRLAAQSLQRNGGDQDGARGARQFPAAARAARVGELDGVLCRAESSGEGTMKTLLKIGPSDHGRPITDDDLRCAEFMGGYNCELIDGRLYVTYAPDLPADWL